VSVVDEQEALEELRNCLNEKRPEPWNRLPDLYLYMDQVVSYLPRQLISFGEGDQITSAMVNNYSKEGLFPRAVGKKYTREHLAYLTAVCALKQVLSVREMRMLLSVSGRGMGGEQFYARFLQVLDRALGSAERQVEAEADSGDLPLLALELALRSYADKLACQRILDILNQNEPHPEKGKQK
jgi:hypothetical protein